MEKTIITDTSFLSKKAEYATQEDQAVIQDLLDTMQAHKDHCVGMAANMIGVLKRIIVIQEKEGYRILVNPEILKVSGRRYEAEEGCLSLRGVRKTKRYENIKIQYLDEQFHIKIKTFTGYSAQIIQHELDHCEGILI